MFPGFSFFFRGGGGGEGYIFLEATTHSVPKTKIPIFEDFKKIKN